MIRHTLSLTKKQLTFTSLGVVSFLSLAFVPVTLGQTTYPYSPTQSVSISPTPTRLNEDYFTLNYSFTHIQLRSLLQEHAMLAALTTSHRFDRNPQFDAAQQQTEQNSLLLGEEIGRHLGRDKQNQFLPLWRHHLVLFIAYTDALVSNRNEDRQRIVDELHRTADQLADSLRKDQKQLPEEIRQHLHQHIELEKAVIDAHAAGNYPEQYRRMHEAHEHAGIMADMIAEYALDK